MTRMLPGLAALLLATTGAVAADLPGRSAPSSFGALPVFTWTGFYVGANVGYGFGDITGTSGPGFGDADGFLAGGQVGYNYQIGQIVVGLEADLQYADVSAPASTTGVAGSKATLDYFGTVRGRLGYAMDRFMPYLTGGYAWGSTELSFPAFGKDDRGQDGYAIGAGLEYAFTQNIIGRVEGLYVDLETQRFFNNTRQAGTEFGVVRAGVNVKF